MNKTMKQVSIIAVGAIATIALVACGSNKQDTSAVEVNIPSLVEDIRAITDGNMPMTMDLTLEEMPVFYTGVTPEMVVEVGGLMPMMQSTSEVTIFKAVENEVDAVVDGLNERKALQEANFVEYLPEQYNIVKSATISSVGDYAYYIAAEPALAAEIESVILDALETGN